MIDHDYLKLLTETPSVGTACKPIENLVSERFGARFSRISVEDGFSLFHRADGRPQDLEAVYIAHADEIGGAVYEERTERRGGYNTRVWGNTPSVFAEAKLQAYDWLSEDGESAFPVQGEVVEEGGEERMVLHGEGIRPFRTAWTFLERTSISNDIIEGKALDPRVTLYSVIEAVRELNTTAVGALIVMAEECAMDVARKAVHFLQTNSPKLRLIVNADVPCLPNLADSRLDMPAIRIFEGRNFIDPSFGIRMSDRLKSKGVEFHLSAARSGSQTILFTPLAPTLSIALPSDGSHLPRVRMSIKGTERCTNLLKAAWEEIY